MERSRSEEKGKKGPQDSRVKKATPRSLGFTQKGMIRHNCHWPGCQRHVPPKLWGCREHWFKLPKDLRDEIWRTYRPGQEISKTPSREYIAAARAVREWIEDSGL